MRTRYILLALAALALASCGGRDYTPKPKAYLRIDMPEHDYWRVDTLWMPKTPYWIGDSIQVIKNGRGYTTFPFIFEVNTCAELAEKDSPQGELWLDIVYPQQDAVVFLTYKRLQGPDDLRGQTDTSQRLLEKHYQFTSGIEEQQYTDPDHRMYATTYRLKGRNVATTYQFWATDREHHFLRGALFLNQAPNNDSLAPILEYIQADMDHLVETLRWR